eukprot:NODE_60_length_25605_cov_0.732377.p5 type:complete len:393 gc:universal NODE_60_length_25605_cov_0.732377:25107-23929(-)
MKHLLSKQSLKRKPSAIRALQPLIKEGMILLGAGLPNESTFPISNISCTVNNTVIQINTKKALQYGPTQGFPEVLADLKEIQNKIHGPPTKYDICVGNGSQSLITKAMEMLLNPDDTILVEKPCYSGVLAFLNPFDCYKVFVNTDENGIQFEHLSEILESWPTNKPKPKCLYTVPTGNNPTGSCTSLEKKKLILELAVKHDFVILEDDPYYYLQYTPERLPSYLSLDTTGHVLRFESFSKVLSSGIRLGMVSGHPTFINSIVLHVQCTDLQATSLSQQLFHSWYSFVQFDGFMNHIGSIVSFYKDKRDFLLRELTKNKIECSSPDAGMFLWLKLPAYLNNEEFMSRLLSENIMVLSGHVFDDKEHIRLTFATPTAEEMEKASTVLAKHFQSK